nr:hypothetical protein [Candidatus Levybacteria bacterium]
MDDTAQNPINQNQSVQPKTEVIADDAQARPQIVTAPVGRAQKETGPVIVSEPIIQRSDTEQEPNLHPEVADAGVEKVTQELQFTTEHKKVGISPSAPTPPTELTNKVKIPTDVLTEEEAKIIVKKGEGSNLDIQKHFEGIYYAPSILGLAILKLKEIGRKLFFQRA